MSQHKWVLSKEFPSSDRTRVFICERCGAGPVTKDIFAHKGSIAKTAKAQGFDGDCSIEVCKGIHES
jgi:hypothetical protein